MFYKEVDFKDTEIGRIPKDWAYGELVDFSKTKDNPIQTGPFGAQLHAHDYVAQGIPLILIKNVLDGRIIEEGMPLVGETKASELGRYRLRVGDIVFSRVGSVGRAAVIEKRQEGWLLSGQMLRVRLENPEVSNDFLGYAIAAKWFQKALESRTVGATRKSINTEILSNLPMVVPPETDQHGIVQVLSCVDLAIQKTDEVIAKTEGLKKGLMKKLLTEGIGHKESKDTEIGKIPKEWKVFKLKDVCSKIQDGTHFSPKPQPTGVPYITSKNIRSWGIDLADAIYVAPKDHIKIFKRCDPKPGDLLYVKDGVNAGTVTVNTLAYEFTLLSSVAMIRPNSDILEPWFLKYALDSPNLKKRHLGLMTGTAIRRLTLDKIRNLKVPVPNIEEQRKISEILSIMDTKSRDESKKKTKLRTIKQGLMDLLLSGKVRVRMD